MYNTPPTFNIYIMGLVFKWIKKVGGVEGILRPSDFFVLTQCVANILPSKLDSCTVDTPNPHSTKYLICEAKNQLLMLYCMIEMEK